MSFEQEVAIKANAIAFIANNLGYETLLIKSKTTFVAAQQLF